MIFLALARQLNVGEPQERKNSASGVYHPGLFLILQLSYIHNVVIKIKLIRFALRVPSFFTFQKASPNH